MSKEEELDKVHYHWNCYVKCGGIDEPRPWDNIGMLGYGGVEHWTYFLQIAKLYLSKYPQDRELIAAFVPKKTVKLLVGE